MQMNRRRIIWTILFILIIFYLLIHSAMKNIHSVKRDIPTLLNFYYTHKNTEPLKAKEALDLILQQDPNNPVAIGAKTNWFLQKGDTHSALDFLQENHLLYPKNQTITYELAKIYILLNQYKNAKPLLTSLMVATDKAKQKEAQVLYQSIFPEEHISPIQESLSSFIEPVHFHHKLDFTALYQRVDEIMNLQPESARNYLQHILLIDPNNSEAYSKLGYLELMQKNNESALFYLVKAFSIKPNPTLAVQIAYLFAQKKDKKQAVFFFTYGLTYGNAQLKKQSQQALSYLEKEQQIAKNSTPPQNLSPEEILWNRFYQNRKINPSLASKTIFILLSMHPKDIKTIKEAAYFEMAQKNTTQAIELWKRAYALDHNPASALSIGYLYDEQNNKYFAFRYFNYASKTSNMEVKTKAELAKTGLAGSQFKILPNPYFAEFYTFPFYYSRFDLGVLPIISRLGKTIKQINTDLYFSYRRTKDNRSGTLQGLLIQNSIPQIFEDNAAIYSAGIRKFPWPKIPVLAFLEIGGAEDLVYKFRPRWRKDVRGGLVYYNAWGVKPTYTNKLTLPLKWIITLYSDMIYYSRYNDNIISTSWFRPGFRVATYHSSSLDLYMANYLILDKNHEFYNNIYSLGPGIALQPNNRINVVFRFEALQGYYIPVNSPTPNPYKSHYWNNLAMLEIYFRF